MKFWVNSFAWLALDASISIRLRLRSGTRTDNMSWQELAAKNVRGILSVEYYFNAQNILEGQLLMAAAEGNVARKIAVDEKQNRAKRQIRAFDRRDDRYPDQIFDKNTD